ncbi:MAG TPA: riboflavin synthase [Clostridia bacterium]|nr:riboflavin synthase [Clostridia bacterium]
MFTGLVEELAIVKKIERGAASIRLTIEAKKILKDVRLGDSIAVNGVCLTVTDFTSTTFTADVMPETMRKTSLSILKAGSLVNVERALSFGSRLGGHLVTGHIDGVGHIKGKKREDIAVVFTIDTTGIPDKYFIPKGAVAIDGISLTIVDLFPNGLSVSIIPHTFKETTLGYKTIGDPVNIEGDIIGKYVLRHLELRGLENIKNKKDQGISLEYLGEHGFL